MRWWAPMIVVGIAACSDPEVPPSADTSGTSGASGSESSTGGIDGSSTSGVVDADSGSTSEPALDPLPPLREAPLTTEQTIVPTHPVEAVTDHGLDPRIPVDLEAMLADGYGDFMLGDGLPHAERTHDMVSPPPPGPGRTRLTRFVHLADAQLLDDETPVRAVTLDYPFFPYPFRAQESYSCHVLNAAVRTLNAVHGVLPLDFVVLGGDNIDSAQQNELSWFLGIMDGAPSVHCDSGDDDDPVPGPDNDPKDPFGPVTLDVPWRWVSGNHDILVQGVFTQTAGQVASAVGSEAPDGTRDWSQPGGPVVQGQVVPDPGRRLVDAVELMTQVMASGDGHGIDDDAIALGRAHYTFDEGGVRFVVVQTATSDGATDGVIETSDVDQFIRPALDAAEAEGLPVVVVSHHASSQLGDGSGVGGTAHPDALDGADWEALLGEYANVVMHLVGHVHHHRIRAIAPLGGTPYWEVMTGALADYPHQMRMVEIYDEDNGHFSIALTTIDYSTEDDPLAAEARARGLADLTSGWLEDGAGDPDERNVVLWTP